MAAFTTMIAAGSLALGAVSAINQNQNNKKNLAAQAASQAAAKAEAKNAAAIRAPDQDGGASVKLGSPESTAAKPKGSDKKGRRKRTSSMKASPARIGGL